MKRLRIKYSALSGEPEGKYNGLSQIADFAVALAEETGESVVFFEVFWPGQSVAGGVWDALRVDASKIKAWDSSDWWVTTLPPYAEISEAEQHRLGIAE